MEKVLLNYVVETMVVVLVSKNKINKTDVGVVVPFVEAIDVSHVFDVRKLEIKVVVIIVSIIVSLGNVV